MNIKKRWSIFVVNFYLYQSGIYKIMLNEIKKMKDSLQRDKMLRLFEIIECFNQKDGLDNVIDVVYYYQL
jgi:hypothetical protein